MVHREPDLVVVEIIMTDFLYKPDGDMTLWTERLRRYFTKLFEIPSRISLIIEIEIEIGSILS